MTEDKGYQEDEFPDIPDEFKIATKDGRKIPRRYIERSRARKRARQKHITKAKICRIFSDHEWKIDPVSWASIKAEVCKQLKEFIKNDKHAEEMMLDVYYVNYESNNPEIAKSLKADILLQLKEGAELTLEEGKHQCHLGYMDRLMRILFPEATKNPAVQPGGTLDITAVQTAGGKAVHAKAPIAMLVEALRVMNEPATKQIEGVTIDVRD